MASLKKRPVVVSLFDSTGYMVEPWAEAGCLCYCFDLSTTAPRSRLYPSGGRIIWLPADLRDPAALSRIKRLRPAILFSFPPCTDLAVSGALRFNEKYATDPLFQQKAVDLAKTGWRIGKDLGIPWFAENPRSMLATLWCPPDWSFSPAQYGGYLPADDVHPEYPRYIPRRDSYDKQTYIWCGNGFERPPELPVRVGLKNSPQYTALGGRDKNRDRIRSATPRGFARAVYLHNRSMVM